MAKISMGNSTDAQAAADMVGRCRALLWVEAGSGNPVRSPAITYNSTLRHASQFGPNAKDGWAEKLAADSAAGTFEFFGLFGASVGVRHISEDLVYKVMVDPADSAYATERDALNSLDTAGKPWLADYFYYDTPKVIVMKPFTWLQTAGITLAEGGTSQPASWFKDTYGATAEYSGMVASNAKFSVYACGLRASNGQLILVDAPTG